jgi:hypothetical protein
MTRNKGLDALANLATETTDAGVLIRVNGSQRAFLSAAELAELCGIPASRVSEWIKTGFVHTLPNAGCRQHLIPASEIPRLQAMARFA